MQNLDLYHYLEQEFEARKKRNPRYSLRSFASQLDIDASQLSKTLKYRLKLTPSFAEKVLPHLQVEEQTKKAIFQSILLDEAAKKEIYKTSKEYYVPEATEAWPFKNRDEIAVLIAMSIPAFSKDLTSIQSNLELSDADFDDAILGLEAQELIKKTEAGDYELVVRQVSDLPNAPVNKFKTQMQKEFLQSALKSLDRTPAEKRLNGTLTLSFDENLLPQAKTKIYNFMREFNAWTMAESRPLNCIYNMTLAFFPLKVEKELE